MSISSAHGVSVPAPKGGRGQARRAERKPPSRPPRTILLNKPYGVVSQFAGKALDEGHATLGSFVRVPDVYAAGRLDKDSEGLLVLTSDGALQHRLANPKAKTPKVYLAQVEGAPREDDVAPLRAGLVLKDGPCKPAQVELIDPPPALWSREPPVRFRKSVPDAWLRITLTEGRNRQVRRMTAAVGLPTLRLIRWSIGPWTVDGLAPGEWRDAPPTTV